MGKNVSTLGGSDKQEKEWQAEDDARTLLRAEEIRRDKARLNAAKQWAQKRLTELNKITKE